MGVSACRLARNWRKTRLMLGLPNEVIAETFSHTVRDDLEDEGRCAGRSRALPVTLHEGHRLGIMCTTIRVCAPKLDAALAQFANEAWDAAEGWSEDQVRAAAVRGKPSSVVRV